VTAPHGMLAASPRDVLGFFDPTLPSSPTQFFRANLPRFGHYDSASDTGSVALTTQVMTAVPIKLAAGDVITNISLTSGATAAGTPTNWWFALYDSSGTPALLAQTADQTTTAWAAFTTKTVPLATAQTISKTGVYWAAAMVKATTVPTFLGQICIPPIVTGERNLAVTSGSALVATAPATLATPTVSRFAPYVVLT
jgi:hypothetical protein